MSDDRRYAAPWLLRQLTDEMGVGLSDISRAIGYPVAALRAYRNGTLDETTTGDVRRAVHDIGLLWARLRYRHDCADPTVLLDCHVVAGYGLRGWNLYRRQDGDRCVQADRALQRPARARLGVPEPRHTTLCALAGGEQAEQVLDREMPGWRERWYSPYRVVTAPDGNLSIVPKGDRS